MVLALLDQGARAPPRDPRVRAPVPGAQRENAGLDCSGAGTQCVLAAGPQCWELRLTSVQNRGQHGLFRTLGWQACGRRRQPWDQAWLCALLLPRGGSPRTRPEEAELLRDSSGSDGETLVSSIRAEWTPPWPFTLRALLLPCPFLTLPAFYRPILQLEKVTVASPAF